jgi:hypothetical protein
METKLHTLLVALKALVLKTLLAIVKKYEPHLMQDLLYAYHPPMKGKHKVGCYCKVKSAKVN